MQIFFSTVAYLFVYDLDSLPKNIARYFYPVSLDRARTIISLLVLKKYPYSDHLKQTPEEINTISERYIIKLANQKVIIGWDFLSLPNIDETLLWNPSLAILGTQSYNPHPQTGMISVSEAFELVRRWHAKECYIVHYRGLLDFEEASNQWFRGPVKAMTTDELQRMVDSHLGIIGDEGKFRITVAKEGMLWDSYEIRKTRKRTVTGIFFIILRSEFSPNS